MSVGFAEILVGILILLVVFFVFLALRELFCWYWKINRIVGLLEDIKAKLGNEKSNKSVAKPTDQDSNVSEDKVLL